MMNRLQYLLNKLAEECNEVAQISLKTAQFGMDEIKPGQDQSNKERVYAELDDLNAIVRMLNDEFGFGYTPYPPAMAEKRDKVNKYWEYSKSLGLVQDE